MLIYRVCGNLNTIVFHNMISQSYTIYFISFFSTMRYRALPAFRWAKASLTSDSENSSVTGVMPWRLQKSSIVLIVAGLPMGDPPTDFSPEINGNTSIFTDGTAPTIVQHL